MGKALYRKYRSKSFDEIVGQEHITDTLKNAIKKGKLSHAYLFTGPRGVGKTSIARILAYAINDLPYDEEATHLDIIEIDAASNRRIDEIRDLRDKVHIAPTSAKYKVYIIDEVHMLTREAFNALLKTLEEPPEHAIFILATTEAHKVPETIISRTQRFTFKPIEPGNAVEHLKEIAKKEGIKISDEALALLGEHGRGSFRDSISMLDQLAGIATDSVTEKEVRLLLGLPDNLLIHQCIQAIENDDVPAVFEVVRLLREQGVDSGRIARSVSEAIRTQLTTGTLSLSHDRAMKLLKSLLPLTLSTGDYLGVEVALLDALAIEAGTVVARPVAPKVPKPTSVNEKPLAEKTPEEPIEKPVEAKVVEATVVETKAPKAEMPEETEYDEETLLPEPVPFSKEQWNEMLHALKKDNNTLYGVLRMAVPVMNDDGLELQFSFGFHKKQVDTPKNTAVIRDFLSTHFGLTHFVTKTVSKQSKTAAKIEVPVPLPDTSIISSVSNIFGGAELLES
jgi:DNA polymerase-3 subunit gamma/tau